MWLYQLFALFSYVLFQDALLILRKHLIETANAATIMLPVKMALGVWCDTSASIPCLFLAFNAGKVTLAQLRSYLDCFKVAYAHSNLICFMHACVLAACWGQVAGT